MKLHEQMDAIQDHSLPVMITDIDTDQLIDTDDIQSYMSYYVQDIYPVDNKLMIWVSIDQDNTK